MNNKEEGLRIVELCEVSDAAAECDARSDSKIQHPTKEQMEKVLMEINAGETSCEVIADKLGMSVDDVAGCALLLMDADLITCDDVEAPE